jgi:hypothetical protein
VPGNWKINSQHSGCASTAEVPGATPLFSCCAPMLSNLCATPSGGESSYCPPESSRIVSCIPLVRQCSQPTEGSLVAQWQSGHYTFNAEGIVQIFSSGK